MHEPTRRPRRPGHRAFMVVVTAFAAAIALTWAWNAVGVELFSAPPASFAEIAAATIAVVTVLALVRALFPTRAHVEGG